jgi:hypothetical protein
MELLLTRRQIARILEQTRGGPDRVEILRRALNRGLDQIEASRRSRFRQITDFAPNGV